MAIFLRAAIDTVNSVFQNDKTDDKKFFANVTARGLVTQNIVSSVPTAVLTASFPLNAESVEFKSIIVNKQIHHIDSTGVITMYNIDKMPLPIPLVTFQILVGLGDQQNNINITTIRDFNSQSALFLPAILDAGIDRIEIPAIKEKFLLTKNDTFLNVFMFMRIADIGDVTNYVTDFNAIYTKLGGALAMGTFYFDISAFVAGKTTLLKSK
jgi:hypothetical protein